MRRLLALTSGMVLIDTVFYAVLAPLLPYLSGEYGLTKAAAGVLSGAFGTGVLLGAAPGGYAASRFGVKPAALAGLLLLASTSLAFGFAGAAWELMALRLLAGFGSALNWVAALTWISEKAPDGRRGALIGTLLSAAVVGALLGPALGSAAVAIGVPLAFGSVAAAGLGVAAWASTAPAPRPSSGRRPPLVGTLKAYSDGPRLAVGFVFIGFSPLLLGVLTVLAPLELSRLGWGTAAIGAVFLASAVVEAAVHPLLGRWSDRAGYGPPIFAGLSGSILVLLALSVAPTATLVALLVVLAAFAFNAPLVPGTALFARETEKAGLEGALAFGVTNFAWASGNAVGSSLGGALAELGGDALPYLSLTGVCLLALLLLRRASPSA